MNDCCARCGLILDSDIRRTSRCDVCNDKIYHCYGCFIFILIEHSHIEFDTTTHVCKSCERDKKIGEVFSEM